MPRRPREPKLPMPMRRRPEEAPGDPAGELVREGETVDAEWRARLDGKLELLPVDPGVYVFRDRRRRVVYVGKAKSLRARVRSYFRGPRPDDPRLATLRRRIRELDYIVVGSETEALILEAHLIKQYTPAFNVKLKDDKKYPYIKITTSSPFPGMFLTRHVLPDGSRYFGPYIRVKDLRQTLKTLRSVFQLRNCSDQRLARDERECLQFFIGRCTAPCTHRVNSEQYATQVAPLLDFLSGKGARVLERLRTRMQDAATAYRFEEAARLRDGVETLEELMRDQRMTPPLASEADVVGLARRGNLACAVFLHVDEGKVMGKSHRLLTGVQGASDEETLRALLLALFLDAPRVPGRIITRVAPADGPGIEAALAERSGHAVSIVPRARGDLRRLLDAAAENARLLLDEEALLRAQKHGRVSRGIFELQEALGMEKPPFRIEGFDISNFQGALPVASIVAFVDGKPLKSDYRRIRMDATPGPDDFAMIGEAVRRRLQRIETKGEPAPDLILVDGGRGQVSRALEVLEAMGYPRLPLAGLAKQEEEIVLPHAGPTLRLPRSSAALQLLQRVRDEAHRFAVSYHRQRRRKAQTRSRLDAIPGIGPTRRKALLRHFGSVDALRRASAEEIARVEGFGPKLALQLREWLGEPAESPPSGTAEGSAGSQEPRDEPGKDASAGTP